MPIKYVFLKTLCDLRQIFWVKRWRQVLRLLLKIAHMIDIEQQYSHICIELMYLLITVSSFRSHCAQLQSVCTVQQVHTTLSFPIFLHSCVQSLHPIFSSIFAFSPAKMHPSQIFFPPSTICELSFWRNSLMIIEIVFLL